MPISKRAELFRRPGPEAALQYLWSRLQDRDLSGAEALAILGAVHHELSQSSGVERRLYASYSRFIGSLDKQMPAVHHYVVAAWTENHFARKRLEALARKAASFDEIPAADPGDLMDRVTSHMTAAGFQLIPLAEVGGEDLEEPGGGEEEDEGEDEHSEPRKGERGEGGNAEQAEEDGSEEESEEKPGDREPEELEEDAEDDPVMETSGEEADVDDAAEADEPEGNEPEPIEDEASAEPEEAEPIPPEWDEEETGAADESPELETGAAGDEEPEWPEMEQPEPEAEEPLEGFGEVDTPPAID